MTDKRCPKCGADEIPGQRSDARMNIIRSLEDERAGWFVGEVFECGSYRIPQSGAIMASTDCLRNQLAQANDKIAEQRTEICHLLDEVEGMESKAMRLKTYYAVLFEMFCWLNTAVGCDSFFGLDKDKWEYASDVAAENGRDEPNQDDLDEGWVRCVADAIKADEAFTKPLPEPPKEES